MLPLNAGQCIIETAFELVSIKAKSF